MNAPLAVYVHWPYCARICPYCDFNVVRDRGRDAEQALLAEAIIADLEAHAALTGPRQLVSIFFGGGTPSLMAPAAIARIIARSRQLWPGGADIEVSLEANPADASAFAAIAAAGVNRLSLGVQSFDDDALCFLGRDHSAAEAIAAVAAARAAVSRVSVDLIYARPGQGAQDWTAELRRALALGVEHISPYQLTIEAGTAFDRAVRRGTLAPTDPELAADLYEVTQEVLSQAGFEAYEVSNHARGAAARSRHNLAYWRGEDYVGVGPGAHGRLSIGGARTATEAARGVGDYLAAVRDRGLGWAASEPMSALDAAEERLLMGLRTVEGVPFADLAPLGLSADDPAVAGLVEQGFVATGAGRLYATGKGRPVLDRLTLDLASAAPLQPA